jgi:hypothetical protein
VRSRHEAEASRATTQGEDSSSRLRVGVLVDAINVQPRWVRQIIQDIQSSSIARVVLVAGCRPADEESARAGARGHAWRNLLYRLYERLDESRHALPDDPFQPIGIEDLLEGCERLDLQLFWNTEGAKIPKGDLAKVRQRRLDVLLHLCAGVPEKDLADIARHGVWSLCHGDAVSYPGTPAGFWEVMESTPLTGSVLRRLRADGGPGEILYRSFASTDWISPRRSKNNYFWKTSAFIIRKLTELKEQRPDALKPLGFSVTDGDKILRAPDGAPGNLKMAGLAMRLAGRYARNAFGRLFYQEEWFLASSRRPDLPQGADLEYSFPPRECYWADPFPVEWNDKYYVFLEEVPHATKKGHISVLTWEGNRMGKTPVKVLERDYHLSYPFLFRWANRWYLIPESVENSTVELYRCVTFPFEWELEKVLMEGERLFDVTVKEIDGRWWMFASKAVGGALEWDELHLFHAETPLGPWRAHSRNPVKSDVRSSRPAGALFEWQGDLHRPAQDCSRRYGYGISINKILKIDPEDYWEVEVSKILPRWDKSILGIHTLNRIAGLTVVDCLRMRPRFW